MKFAEHWRRATQWLHPAGTVAAGIGASASMAGGQGGPVSMPFCVSYGRAVFCLHLPAVCDTPPREPAAGPHASSSSDKAFSRAIAP